MSTFLACFITIMFAIGVVPSQYEWMETQEEVQVWNKSHSYFRYKTRLTKKGIKRVVCIVIIFAILLITFLMLWNGEYYDNHICDRCGRESLSRYDSGMCFYCEREHPLCENCGYSYISINNDGLCSDCEYKIKFSKTT